MDANEYLEENHPDLMIYIKAYIPTEVDLTAALNGYHQAKSKEEARERYEMAAKYWENEVMAIFNDEEELPDKFPKPSQVFKYGQLAAFGKEGEG